MKIVNDYIEYVEVFEEGEQLAILKRSILIYRVFIPFIWIFFKVFHQCFIILSLCR